MGSASDESVETAAGEVVIDGHVHVMGETVDQKSLLERMRAAGVSGAVLMSAPPSSHEANARPARDRLDNLLAWVEGSPDLYPVFWIDPLEPDALEQVALASRSAVRGFKVICSSFYPGDPRAIEVYRAIAETGKPVMFHSGILWDGQDSSRYNRPVEFESLLAVPDLRFSLAHVSWPWCDEHIALFGKLQRSRLSGKMFVDLTPGTPPIYRREVLTKLFTVGYDVGDNVFFGTDGIALNYSVENAQRWLQRDNAIYDSLGLSKDQRDKIYAGNVKRFLGV
jgi:predicted TIM-barrel fold metal-dependent hydrolase